jgi:hypothetical protein
VSGDWAAVKLAILPVLSVEDAGAVVDQDGRRFLVPGAFLAPVAPARALAAGDAVLVGTAGTRVFGRVVGVRPGKVEVRFKFAAAVQTREVGADEVVEIDGRPFLGAPVRIRDRDLLRFGQLVHQGATKTWVVQIGGRARSLPPADVELLPAPPPFAVGDEVLALRIDKLMPATVTAVLDDRLQYEVKWAGGEETSIATYEAVTRKK